MLAELPALPAERGDEFLGQPRKQFDARCGNVQNLVLARQRTFDEGPSAPELDGEQIAEHITMTSTQLGTNITATLADLSATSLWTITKMGTAAAHKLPVTAGRRCGFQHRFDIAAIRLDAARWEQHIANRVPQFLHCFSRGMWRKIAVSTRYFTTSLLQLDSPLWELPP